MSELNETQKKALEKQESMMKYQYPLYGLGMIAFGVYLFFKLSAFEQSGGSMSLHWFFYYAYQLGGKWLVSAILCLIGALFTFTSVKKILKNK
ncbi:MULTISPECIES: hypothetical protein [Chitinophagaceae]